MVRLTRILLPILGIPIGYLVYSMFSVDKSDYIIMLIPLGMLFATIVVLRHQIDSWWIKRQKPELDPTLHKILRAKVTHYDELFQSSDYETADHMIFNYECDFIGQGFDSIPDDLKHIITAHAFYFGGKRHKKWPNHYNRIALYKHPFLTPQISEAVHSVEHHEEDGVFIFSMEQGLHGLDHPDRYYNIFIHGFADAFFDLYPLEKNFDEEKVWSTLQMSFGITRARIVSIIGLEDISLAAVLAHYYIYHPEKMLATFPEFKSTLFDLININVKRS